ncbi:MAG: SDR family oxidoreductase [Proteobacteria bacterium]|nr:SDR family oxidoreductase [Pseudomonadota bacterium]
MSAASTASGAGRLAGKVAVVTGAGQGIGEAIARRFAAEGAFVMLANRSAETGVAVAASIRAAGGRADFTACDAGQRAALEQLVARTVDAAGAIDIVVHNAAAFSRDPLAEMDDDALDRLLDVNLKACFHLVRAALPHMRAQGGRVLVTSSITGPRVAMPNTAHYAASKAGVNGFIRSAALELAARGITVNGVEPGYIDTPAMTHLKARFGLDALTRYIPAKRLGAPEDIAAAMLFLASDEAAYITGQTLVVDGGSTLPESPLFMQ